MAESFDSILATLNRHTEGQALKAFIKAESVENGPVVIPLDKILWVQIVDDTSAHRIYVFLVEGKQLTFEGEQGRKVLAGLDPL